MFILDALLRIFAFFQAQLFSGQVPQDNGEAHVYNFFQAVLNFFALIGS